MKYKIILPLFALALPIFTYAQTFEDFLKDIKRWLGLLLPILMGVALLVFLWGLVIFIAKSADETARSEGRQRMIWGIIALFVAVSIWGLVNFISESTGIDQGTAPSAPQIPRQST